MQQKSLESLKARIASYDHSEDNHSLGVFFLQNQKYIEALVYLKRALETDSSQVGFLRSYIQILEILKLAQEASFISHEFAHLIDIETSERLNSIKLPNSLNIVPEHEVLELVNSVNNLEPVNFLKKCDAFIRIHPLNATGYLMGAICQTRLRNYQDARNLCLIASALDPYNSEVLLTLGDIHRNLKNYQCAFNAYTRGLGLNKNHQNLRNNLSVLLNQWEKPDHALEHIEVLLAANPQNCNALFNKAISFSKLKRLREATNLYDRVIKYKPSFQNAYINKAALHIEQKENEAAIKTLQRLLQINPNSQAGLQNLASHYAKQRKVTDAIQTYNTLLLVNPNHIPALINLGIIHKNRGEIKEAISLFEHAISLNSNLPQAYNNLGTCFMSLRNFKDAERMFTHAINLDKNFPDPLMNYLSLLRVYSPSSKSSRIARLNSDVSNYFGDLPDLLELSADDFAHFLGGLYQFSDELHSIFNVSDKQIMIRNDTTIDLNCRHRMKLYNTHCVISDFCLSCYKVQITLRHVNDLIKLLLIMKSFAAEFGPLMKCMEETRSGVDGKFKGFIYFRSQPEMKTYLPKIKNILNRYICDFQLSTKRGCSEFYDTHPEYKNLDSSAESIQDIAKALKIEREFDQTKTQQKVQVFHQTLTRVDLLELLVMMNWLTCLNCNSY